MENSILLSLLIAVVGGFCGAYFQAKYQHKKDVDADIHQLKRTRYGAILIQMLAILDPEKGLPKAKQFRADLNSVEDFKKEVKTEMLHSILFANDAVIKAMSEFVDKYDYVSYIKTASAMRKDLWNNDTKIGEDILKEFSTNKD